MSKCKNVRDTMMQIVRDEMKELYSLELSNSVCTVDYSRRVIKLVSRVSDMFEKGKRMRCCGLWCQERVQNTVGVGDGF